MSEPDGSGVFADARVRIRDAAKWMVTISGSALVLVVGGGVLANIPKLETSRMLVASTALVGLGVICLVPLLKVVRILVSPFLSFQEILDNDTPEYVESKKRTEKYLASQSVGLSTLKELAAKRQEIAAEIKAANWWELSHKRQASEQLEQLVRVSIELTSIRVLERRFDGVMALMKWVGIAAVACVIALICAFREAPGETPVVQSIPAAHYYLEFVPGHSCDEDGQMPRLMFRDTRGSGATEHVSFNTLAGRLRMSGETLLRVVGAADSQPMTERARKVYGNDVSLALARAYCVAGTLQTQLALKGVFVQTIVGVRGPEQRAPSNLDRLVEVFPLP